MHYLYQPQISYLLELLPRVGRGYATRTFDQDLFHLLDERELEVRTFTDRRMIGNEHREKDDVLSLMQRSEPSMHDEIMIVTRLQEVDDDLSSSPEMAPTGYLNHDKEFVPWPEFTPLPHYSTVTEEARRFTSSLFSGRLKIEVREVDPVGTGDWELTSLAKLSLPNGEVVSEHLDGSWAMAIVGATLKALTVAPGLLAIDVEIVQ